MTASCLRSLFLTILAALLPPGTSGNHQTADNFFEEYTNCAWNYSQLLNNTCPNKSQSHATYSHSPKIDNANGKTRITFIGDSITQAHHVSANESFPHKLQVKLGDRFALTNLGVSGATMLTNGTAEDGKCPASFRGTPQWQMALERAADIIFVLLGTNDAKAYNWDPVRYRSDYLAMLEAIQQRHAQSKIILVIPPPLLNDGFGAMNQSVINHEIPRIIQDINVQMQFPHEPVDMVELFGGSANPDPALLLEDGCHPNERGYEKMATKLFDVLSQRASPIEQAMFSNQYTNCAWDYEQVLDRMCADRYVRHATCSLRAQTADTEGRTRVTFIGDSITQAHHVSPLESFPHKLQLKLGERFAIANLGVSGATMLTDGTIEDGKCPASYRSTPQWQMALESAADVFFVVLGTNDAKAYNWDPVRYRSDYLSMIETIQQNVPRAEVVLVFPPPLFNDGFGAMSRSAINDEIPRIIQNVSAEAKLLQQPVNMVELFGGSAHPDPALLLEDGCHPNERGYEKMATKLSEVLSSMMSSPLSDTYTNCAWNYDQLLDHTCPGRKRPHETCSHSAETLGTGNKTRITFIGDSITQAHHVDESESFPHKLQRKAGERYAITNLGVSGATMSVNGTAEGGMCPASYRITPQWSKALQTSADLIFIMLGTNDAKAYNWDAGRFRNDYMSLLSAISAAHPQAGIVLMIPPPLIADGFGAMKRSVINEELPNIIRSINTEAGLPLEPVDMVALFGGASSPDSSLLLEDGCHPNERGYERMASRIMQVLPFWDGNELADPAASSQDAVVVDAAMRASSFTYLVSVLAVVAFAR